MIIFPHCSQKSNQQARVRSILADFWLFFPIASLPTVRQGPFLPLLPLPMKSKPHRRCREDRDHKPSGRISFEVGNSENGNPAPSRFPIVFRTSSAHCAYQPPSMAPLFRHPPNSVRGIHSSPLRPPRPPRRRRMPGIKAFKIGHNPQFPDRSPPGALPQRSGGLNQSGMKRDGSTEVPPPSAETTAACPSSWTKHPHSAPSIPESSYVAPPSALSWQPGWCQRQRSFFILHIP